VSCILPIICTPYIDFDKIDNVMMITIMSAPSKALSIYNRSDVTQQWGISKSFRTGRLERELQMVQLSATKWSFITILWVSLVSFAAITLCVASQRVIPEKSIYFLSTQSGNFWMHPRMSTDTAGRCHSQQRRSFLTPFERRTFPFLHVDTFYTM
jgi:hypothetical protein